jgi:ABC-type cobalamin/Fe3+-siderophores transport system ATPase subunit
MDELNTIIIVTHDVTAACSVSDHLWLMGRDHDVSRQSYPWSQDPGHVRPHRTRSLLAPRDYPRATVYVFRSRCQGKVPITMKAHQKVLVDGIEIFIEIMKNEIEQTRKAEDAIDEADSTTDRIKAREEFERKIRLLGHHIMHTCEHITALGDILSKI